jgi:hypothetical protein
MMTSSTGTSNRVSKASAAVERVGYVTLPMIRNIIAITPETNGRYPTPLIHR